MSRVALALLLLLAPVLHAADVHVSVDASFPPIAPGKADSAAPTRFPTIQNALDHHPFATPNPDGTPGRVFIEIAPGTYRERVIVTQNHRNITLLGMGKTPADTIITNALNAKQAGGTFFTETVEINGDGFQADNLTFENTAGNTGQAVAAAVRADRVIFKHCRFLGHQDTLFADYGRQYYVDSYLEGGVDYIFGNAAAVFERDELHSNGPGSITAQSRTSAGQATGYVILNSRVTADQCPDHAPECRSNVQILLGRPWRPYARTVYLNTELPAQLNPAGWNNWGNAANEATAWYAESGSTGPGAPQANIAIPRVLWAHKLTPADIAKFQPDVFLAGPSSGLEHWDPTAEAAKLP